MVVERSFTSDSLTDDGDMSVSRVYIALQYIPGEKVFNFYVKQITNPPLFILGRRRRCRARMLVVKDVARTNWMGRSRMLTAQEIAEKTPTVHRTLAVKRENPTIFNEFFTESVEPLHFPKTLLRIQLVDVDKAEREVVTGEADYWIDSNPIHRFSEFAIVMQPAKPDLGELEFSLMYQPTIGRIVVDKAKGTNLPVMNDTLALYIRGQIYRNGRLREEEIGADITTFTEESASFQSRLIFENITPERIQTSTIALVVVEKTSEGRELAIGEVIVSAWEKSADRMHWQKMIAGARDLHAETHKLAPSI